MKIIHMIPNDGLGGVEQAARSLNPDDRLDIKTVFVCGEKLSNKKHIKVISENIKLNSIGFYFQGFKFLLLEKPDLLICSLWRISFIGVFYLLFMKAFSKKKVKLIIFIHNNTFGHFLDKIITKTAILFADEIWCDSTSSKESIVSENYKKNNVKVISFFVGVDRDKSLPKVNKKDNFVFWGRLAKQKRLDRAIEFFNSVRNEIPNSLFFIYGPDCGELYKLKVLVEKLNLKENVFFMGSKIPGHYPEEVLTSKFFINTSTHEGMAISVVEAMQLGLVPVVTPVGEVGRYCEDQLNSIYYNNKTKDRVLELIDNNNRYYEMSNNAILHWQNKKDYSKDFNENCFRLINEF